MKACSNPLERQNLQAEETIQVAEINAAAAASRRAVSPCRAFRGT
jgi:hypothetical protein